MVVRYENRKQIDKMEKVRKGMWKDKKAVLFDFFHKKVSDLSDYFRFEEGELFGYDLDRCPIMR